MEAYPAMKQCPKPCIMTQSNIIEKGNALLRGNKKSKLQLLIDKQVVHKTKMLGYGFSNFLIDMGSSMGFWFGLSVFGLADLGISIIDWVNDLKERTKNIF